ncbi:hypothetical protein AVEN_111641-1 [Araneus ventricosus]|uniref:Uncharacterized protein n=1 Tax=Araneus ventricosus TaxID=182803 RepID=A0A4Y2C296_ARAVE|nr:hypothetical protein AVEN_111641-1 [Araneus ventricosus]
MRGSLQNVGRVANLKVKPKKSHTLQEQLEANVFHIWEEEGNELIENDEWGLDDLVTTTDNESSDGEENKTSLTLKTLSELLIKKQRNCPILQWRLTKSKKQEDTL